RGEVGLATQARYRMQRFQLRCERDRAVSETRVDERLLPETVPRKHEAPPWRVPQRNGEHPFEMLHEVRPVLLVEVRDHRRVAAAAHLVPPRRELLAQLGEVV